jgi:hypothetical protein
MFDKLVKIYDDFAKGERQLDLEQLSKEYQFSFKKRESFGIQPTDIKGFQVFAKKGSKRFLGILSRPTESFKGYLRFYDYLVTKDLETTTHSVVEIYNEQLFTDYFTIEPKGAFRKVKGFFMSEEKIFPRLKDFHSKFVISSKDPDATTILKPSVCKLMLAHPRITVEAEGNYYFFILRKKEMKVSDVVSTVDFAEEFVRLLQFDVSDDFV